jgi:outer membrane protein
MNTRTPRILALALAGGFLLSSLPSVAQEDLKVAVIDVRRLVTDSQAGKQVLDSLQQVSDQKSAQLQQMANEMEDLRTRITEGRLSLSQERLAELEKEFDDKRIAFGRARDDADRELQKMQQQRFGSIEQRVLPIINEVGQELGYTLIFNKFESGLVFALDSADITDLILQRFDAVTASAEGTD